MSRLVTLFIGIVFPAVYADAASVITVTSATDVLDGNVISAASLAARPGADGVVSLREALTVAKEEPDLHIRFADSLGIIAVLSPLPVLKGSGTVIEGGGIALDGRQCPDCIGLEVLGADNTIDNVSIIGFPRSALSVHGRGANRNTVRDCSIGLIGNEVVGNGFSALVVKDGASYNLIVGTVVGGNKGNGIVVRDKNSRGNKVFSNFVGTTRDGLLAVPNGSKPINGLSYSTGIVISDSPETQVGLPGQGNLVSAYHSTCISVDSAGSAGTRIQGNEFALQPNVYARVPDGYATDGILIGFGANGITVGGPTEQEGNLITTYLGAIGIRIFGKGTGNLTIANNVIRASTPSDTRPTAGVHVSAPVTNCIIGPNNTMQGYWYGVKLKPGTGAIVLTRNHVSGNSLSGIYLEDGPNGGILPPTISAAAPFLGKTVPCGTVEFFADTADQGELYLGTAFADQDGDFELLAPVDVPDGMNITTTVTDRYNNSSEFSAPVPVALVTRGEYPDASICRNFYYATADENRDFVLSLSELLRVIQLYNGNSYSCFPGTEDGYDPGAGDTSCIPHSADFAPQDWVIDLPELLRVIQLYHADHYDRCDTGEDGFCPVFLSIFD